MKREIEIRGKIFTVEGQCQNCGGDIIQVINDWRNTSNFEGLGENKNFVYQKIYRCLNCGEEFSKIRERYAI